MECWTYRGFDEYADAQKYMAEAWKNGATKCWIIAQKKGDEIFTLIDHPIIVKHNAPGWIKI